MANDNQVEAGDTIIGASVKVEGDLNSEGDIRVEGFVTGKIKTNKNLFVGPTAKIEADVEAENADLAGSVSGQVKVKGTLQIRETGKIDGDIACAILSIAEGAHFSGTCSMPEEKEGLEEPIPEEEEK